MGVYTVNQTDGSLQRVAGGTLYADAPIGAIQSYGGVIAPAGWLICDGSAVSRTEYAELFAVIGINFGEGDGETTFGIPDLRECVPVGVGKNITKSIGAHDRYELGQFKDDQVQANYKVSFLPASFSWGASGGGSSAYGGTNANLRIGDNTHGKRLGVNYIIKAKMVALPADLASGVEELINTENILWENQNPDSAFSAQDVTLANDNYRYLTIYYKEYAGRNYYLSVKFPKGVGCCLNKIDVSSNDYYVYSRICSYTNSTKLLFADAYQSSQSSANNGHCIPIKIVGSMT